MMSAIQATPSRHKLGPFAGFALTSLALIGLAGAGLSLLFRGEGDLLAIWLSAAIAWTTQMVVFPAVRKLVATNLIVGWALGSIVRMGTLLIYALLGIMVFKLAMTAALVGLAVFYFLSMLIEPLFLRS